MNAGGPLRVTLVSANRRIKVAAGAADRRTLGLRRPKVSKARSGWHRRPSRCGLAKMPTLPYHYRDYE
jgi:hypothetical protein